MIKAQLYINWGLGQIWYWAYIYIFYSCLNFFDHHGYQMENMMRCVALGSQKVKIKPQMHPSPCKKETALSEADEKKEHATFQPYLLFSNWWYNECIDVWELVNNLEGRRCIGGGIGVQRRCSRIKSKILLYMMIYLVVRELRSC